MKNRGRLLVIFGIIIAIAGIIFSLQSKSVIGPTSSFMYDNPEWTADGLIIIAIGLISLATGGFMLFRRKRSSGSENH